VQVAILCGGRGTRLGRESEVRPKPMAEIGGRPILWHIMKYYAGYGHREFILCLGYLGDVIRDYFLNYEARRRDVTVELGGESRLTYHSDHDEDDWRVTLADTGPETGTGGRVKRIERYIREEPFFLTYGDGVSDVDLDDLARFHREHGKAATVTAVHPPARFGEVQLDEGRVRIFSEKPQTSHGRINGGFFVLDRRIFDYLSDDRQCVLEQEPMVRLTADGELMAYKHPGFWQCMDTVRELNILTELWETGRAPWRNW
jgi:glucose-1-phosphate cytidylyltransferase